MDFVAGAIGGSRVGGGEHSAWAAAGIGAPRRGWDWAWALGDRGEGRLWAPGRGSEGLRKAVGLPCVEPRQNTEGQLGTEAGLREAGSLWWRRMSPGEGLETPGGLA